MTPTMFDDRARAQTHALLSDAQRIPSQAQRERSTSAPWKVVAVFTATALVICVAVVGASLALHSSPAGTAHPTTNLSTRWKSFFIPDLGGTITSVSCPDPNNCVAVDVEGDVITSTNPSGGAGAWKVASIDPSANVFGQTTLLPTTGVSCADPSLCVAVDQGGNVIVSTNPGGGAAAWTLSGIDGLASLSGISCPDEHLCVAVGSTTAAGYPAGVVLTSTDPADGPDTWKVVTLNASGLTAVSCPSPSLCVALDGGGEVVTSTDPTGGAGAWSSAGVDSTVSNTTAISCPSAYLCVAVDSDGNVLTSTNPTGGAGAWTLTNVSPDITGEPQFASVACPSMTFCVIGDFSNSVLVSSDPTGGSGAWTPVQVSQDEIEIFGLSCPSNRFCVGVDGSDNIHIYRDPSP
jgi:hypothetical protein